MSIRKFSTASISAGTNKSTKLWDQETFQSGMFALATVSLTTTASSVVFSGIPSNYTHLQIRALAQTNRGTYGVDSLHMTFNGDAGSNYTVHWLYGDGSSASSGSLSNPTTYLRAGDGLIGTSTGGTFGAAVIDVLDYTSSSKNKTMRTLSGVDVNGTVGGIGGRAGLGSGVWLNSSAAISSINLFPQAGTLWTANSHFALYGIKVAS